LNDDVHQSPEIIMTTQAKLTDTQTAVLKVFATCRHRLKTSPASAGAAGRKKPNR
jgi:hypothetical protein